MSEKTFTLWSDNRGGWYAKYEGEQTATHLIDNEELYKFLGEHNESDFQRGITSDKMKHSRK